MDKKKEVVATVMDASTGKVVLVQYKEEPWEKEVRDQKRAMEGYYLARALECMV